MKPSFLILINLLSLWSHFILSKEILSVDPASLGHYPGSDSVVHVKASNAIRENTLYFPNVDTCSAIIMVLDDNSLIAGHVAMLAPSSNFSLPAVLRDNYYLNFKYTLKKMEKVLSKSSKTVTKLIIISGDISHQEIGLNGPNLTFKMINDLFEDYPPIHFLRTPGTQNHIKINPSGKISIYKRNQGPDLLSKDLSEMKEYKVNHHKVIWKWLKKNRKAKWGHLPFYFVPVKEKDSNCHHFSFGNLEGDLRDFNYHTLKGEEGWSIAKSFPPQLHPLQKQRVVIYGFPGFEGAHSSRQEKEDGLYWHKFVGLPYVLGFEKQMLGNYEINKVFNIQTYFGNYDQFKTKWVMPK